MQVEDGVRDGWTDHQWGADHEAQGRFPIRCYPRGMEGGVGVRQCILTQGNQVLTAEGKIGKSLCNIDYFIGR